MYSNVFDTVKKSNEDLINFEGLLYCSILNGLHPTFSLNQVIDSIALQSIVQNNDSFIELIKKGYIRVAVYGQYKGNKKDILNYLTDKLTECMIYNKASFKFSSLSFLYNGQYDEKQCVELYKSMAFAINNKININSNELRNIGITSDDTNKINEYMQTIYKIEDALCEDFILPSRNKSSSTLSVKLINEICMYEKEIKDDNLYLLLNELKKELIKAKNNFSKK